MRYNYDSVTFALLDFESSISIIEVWRWFRKQRVLGYICMRYNYNSVTFALLDFESSISIIEVWRWFRKQRVLGYIFMRYNYTMAWRSPIWFRKQHINHRSVKVVSKATSSWLQFMIAWRSLCLTSEVLNVIEVCNRHQKFILISSSRELSKFQILTRSVQVVKTTIMKNS